MDQDPEHRLDQVNISQAEYTCVAGQLNECDHPVTNTAAMAEAAFSPPMFNSNADNLCQGWRDFQDDMSNYLLAAGLSHADGERKVAILLYGLGTRYRKIFRQFVFTEADHKKDYARVCARFNEHFEPKRVTKLYMKKFDALVQKPGESIGEYISNLREVAHYCDFGDTLDSQLCKQISSGVRSPSLRDRLWSEDLTLDQIIAKCHLHEQKEESQSVISNLASARPAGEIHYTSSRGRASSNSGYRGGHRGRTSSSRRPSHDSSSRSDPTPQYNSQQRGHRRPHGSRRGKCGGCGYVHGQGQQCPAYGKHCRFCGVMNHFEVVCRKKRQVHNVEADNSLTEHTDEDPDRLFVYSSQPQKRVSAMTKLNKIKWTVDLKLSSSHSTLLFKIDTGSDCSCISLNTYHTHVRNGLVESQTRISGISAPPVMPIGKVDLHVKYHGSDYIITCEVLDQGIPNLIGLDDSIRMNLISRVDSMSAGTSAGTSRCPNTRADSNLFSHVKCKYPEPLDLVKQYTDVFTGVGRIPGEVSLKIDPDAIPVAHPPRPVPEPLRGAIQEKLAQLERDGIIVKIPPGTPTPWCAPMHTVLKKSKIRDTGPVTVDEIRMTIDPRDLNKALLREYHPINTVEQVIAKAHGSKVFTKLDARQGFFQLVLDEPSSMLTAFKGTPSIPETYLSSSVAWGLNLRVG